MQNSARNTSNALTLNGAQLSTDGTFAGNSDALVPSQKAVNTLSATGWIASPNETWAYTSASSPNFTFTVATDLTTKYSKDMKVRLTQSQALTNYWSFDTDSTDSIANTSMTNIATPVYSAGKFSNALTLNGSSQALKCADNTFKPTSDFTVGGWVKGTNASAAMTIFQSFRSTGTTVWNGFQIKTVITSGYVSVTVAKNTGAVLNTDYSLITGKTNVCDNTFHYLVVTYKDNMVKIYVDGALDAFGYSLAPVYNATTYTRIGCSDVSDAGATPTVWWNGQIDDLFLINGAVLDEQTIKEKYIANTAQGTGNLTLTKYFTINSVSYTPSTTTISIFGGSDYTLANATISSPYYAMVQNPFRMDMNANKWPEVLSPFYTFLIAGAFSPPAWCKKIQYLLFGAGGVGGVASLGGNGGSGTIGILDVADFKGNFGITYGSGSTGGNTYFTALPNIVGLGAAACIRVYGDVGSGNSGAGGDTGQPGFCGAFLIGAGGGGGGGANSGAQGTGGAGGVCGILAGGVGGASDIPGRAGSPGNNQTTPAQFFAGSGGGGGGHAGYGTGGNGGVGGYGSGGGGCGYSGVGGAGGAGFAVIWFLKGSEI